MSHNIIGMDLGKMDPNMLFKPKETLIIVDYSNLLYRAFYSCVKDLEIRPWMPFIRALDMLRSCAKQVLGVNAQASISWAFCGDSVRTKLDRMKIDPEYKEDRPPLSNLRFYIFRNLMTTVLKDLGMKVLYRDGAEGDDIIASLVDNVRPRCKCEKKCAVCECEKGYNIGDVVIFSMDKDLNSLLAYSNVKIYRPPAVWYTRADFDKDYGFDPNLFGVYKALVGDKSDGIKPVPLWGDARAKTHIKKKDWEAVLWKDGDWDAYTKNLALVTLNYEVAETPCCGSKFIFVDELNEGREKIRKEYRSDNAVDDVIFASKRLIEECGNNE